MFVCNYTQVISSPNSCKFNDCTHPARPSQVEEHPWQATVHGRRSKSRIYCACHQPSVSAAVRCKSCMAVLFRRQTFTVVYLPCYILHIFIYDILYINIYYMFLSAVCKKGVWGRGSLVQFAALNRMLDNVNPNPGPFQHVGAASLKGGQVTSKSSNWHSIATACYSYSFHDHSVPTCGCSTSWANGCAVLFQFECQSFYSELLEISDHSLVLQPKSTDQSPQTLSQNNLKDTGQNFHCSFVEICGNHLAHLGTIPASKRFQTLLRFSQFSQRLEAACKPLARQIPRNEHLFGTPSHTNKCLHNVYIMFTCIYKNYRNS